MSVNQQSYTVTFTTNKWTFKCNWGGEIVFLGGGGPKRNLRGGSS